MRAVASYRKFLVFLVASLLFGFPFGSAQAGWLSNLLENGKLPPLQDVGLCVIAPALCAANEVNKDQLARKKAEMERDTLRDRLVSYRNDVGKLLKDLDIKDEKERKEIEEVLNEADEWLLKAKDLTGADTCNLNARKEIYQIHRKYQNMG